MDSNINENIVLATEDRNQESNIAKKLELEYLFEEDKAQALNEEDIFFALAVSTSTGKSLTLFDLDWLTNIINEDQ